MPKVILAKFLSPKIYSLGPFLSYYVCFNIQPSTRLSVSIAQLSSELHKILPKQMIFVWLIKIQMIMFQVGLHCRRRNSTCPLRPSRPLLRPADSLSLHLKTRQEDFGLFSGLHKKVHPKLFLRQQKRNFESTHLLSSIKRHVIYQQTTTADINRICSHTFVCLIMDFFKMDRKAHAKN